MLAPVNCQELLERNVRLDRVSLLVHLAENLFILALSLALRHLGAQPQNTGYHSRPADPSRSNTDGFCHSLRAIRSASSREINTSVVYDIIGYYYLNMQKILHGGVEVWGVHAALCRGGRCHGNSIQGQHGKVWEPAAPVPKVYPRDVEKGKRSRVRLGRRRRLPLHGRRGSRFQLWQQPAACHLGDDIRVSCWRRSSLSASAGRPAQE